VKFCWIEPRPNFLSWLFELIRKAQRKLQQVPSGRPPESTKKEDSADILITSIQPLYAKIGTSEKHCVNFVIQNRTVTNYNFVLVV
jgi:hypothetical protein